MKRSAEPLLEDVSPDPAKVARVDEIQQLLNKDNKIEIMDKLHQMVVENNFTIIDLIYQIPEGLNKGTSVLWWLARGSTRKPEAFLAVWDKCKDNPGFQSQLLEGLLVQAQAGEDKGKSALWWLAFGVFIGKPEAFLVVWDKYKDNLVLQSLLLEGLLAQAEQGEYKGKFALWWLAFGIYIGKPEAFLVAWDKYKNNPDFQSQLLEGLLVQAQAEGEGDKGKSALWWLATGLANGKPEAFFSVWDKYKDNPSLQPQLLKGLLAQAQAGEDKGKSAIFWLIKKNKNERIRQILKDIFALLPGCIAADNPHINKLIQLKIVSVKLIHARNAFFTTLESAKKQSALTKEGIESLMELADEAQQQGYINAFNDVGHFIDRFEQEGDLLAPVADEAFERVSPLSPHYEWACIRCAENKFNLARFESAQSNALLRDSLKFVLDIKDPNTGLEGIRRVAALYIFGPDYPRFQLPIYDEQLLLMRDKNSIERYFSYFDEVKKIVEVEKDINKQIEAVKALNVVFSLQQSNPILMFSAAPTASSEISSSSIEPPKM